MEFNINYYYRLVEGDFKPKDYDSYHQINNVHFGAMRQPNGEEQIVLLISKNGGEILSKTENSIQRL